MKRAKWPKECPVFEYGADGGIKYLVEAFGPYYSLDLETYGEPVGIEGRFYVGNGWCAGLWTLEWMDTVPLRPLTPAARELLALVKK